MDNLANHVKLKDLTNEYMHTVADETHPDKDPFLDVPCDAIELMMYYTLDIAAGELHDVVADDLSSLSVGVKLVRMAAVLADTMVKLRAIKDGPQ